MLDYADYMENHFLIRVLEWASKKPEGFSVEELEEGVTLEDWQKEIIKNYMVIAVKNAQDKSQNEPYNTETIFFVVKEELRDPFDVIPGNEARYILSTNALFHYIDYTELQFARKTAKEARDIAVGAVYISIILSLFAPLIVSHLIIQSVEIERFQFEQIKNLLEGK